MLVLSRKAGEKIRIGDNIVVTINRVSNNRVSIGIEAPNQVHITRGELEVFPYEPQPHTRPVREPAKPLTQVYAGRFQRNGTGFRAVTPVTVTPPTANVPR